MSKCGNVTTAAQIAGGNRTGFYKERQEDSDFAELWDEALYFGGLGLEDEARRRAVEGTDEPVFYRGQICGHIKKYSDVLLIFLLKSIFPEKFRGHFRLDLSNPDGTMTPPKPNILANMSKADVVEIIKRAKAALKGSEE